MSAVLVASIRELCRADHGDDPAALADWMENKTPEAVAGWIGSGRTRLLVAERGGEIAGVGGWTQGAAPDERTIVLLYVAPAHRGAGVSTALLARMEADMAAAGCRRARLESTVTAHAFYRARGWRDAGAPCAGRGGVCLPMARDLPG